MISSRHARAFLGCPRIGAVGHARVHRPRLQHAVRRGARRGDRRAAGARRRDPGSSGWVSRSAPSDSSVPILLTHYHWDHTQGLPFFSPFFDPGATPSIWAPHLEGVSVEWVERIFASPYFPVPFGQLPNQPVVTLVQAGYVRDRRLPHQRAAAQPSRRRLRLPDSRRAGRRGLRHRSRVRQSRARRAARGVLPQCRRGHFDAHFTPDGTAAPLRLGARELAAGDRVRSACGAGHLCLFHHKPGRSDHELAD